MDSPMNYQLAADAILLLHALIAAFIVIGLVLIFIGKARRWYWIRNPWFRLFHVSAIAIVALQSWFGRVCPLTTIEMELRSRAGDSIYSGSFISHWIEKVLYYQLPPWVFVVGYTVFTVIVIASWLWIRPRRF
jgi:hypothetical protein